MIIRSEGQLEGIGHMMVLQNGVIIIHNGQLLAGVDQIGISPSRMIEIVDGCSDNGSYSVVFCYIASYCGRIQEIGSRLNKKN